MKRIATFIIVLTALAACTALPTQVAPEPAATDMPQAGLPNPASVYCTQGGNKLEIRTAADGSQNGVCVFPDGSACDEWAYFRGECGPREPNMPGAAGGYKPPETAEKLADWWGVIKSTPPGAQFDDYFERRDLGQIIYFGIDSHGPGGTVPDRGAARQRQDRASLWYITEQRARCQRLADPGGSHRG